MLLFNKVAQFHWKIISINYYLNDMRTVFVIYNFLKYNKLQIAVYFFVFLKLSYSPSFEIAKANYLGRNPQHRKIQSSDC